MHWTRAVDSFDGVVLGGVLRDLAAGHVHRRQVASADVSVALNNLGRDYLSEDAALLVVRSLHLTVHTGGVRVA